MTLYVKVDYQYFSFTAASGTPLPTVDLSANTLQLFEGQLYTVPVGAIALDGDTISLTSRPLIFGTVFQGVYSGLWSGGPLPPPYTGGDPQFIVRNPVVISHFVTSGSSNAVNPFDVVSYVRGIIVDTTTDPGEVTASPLETVVSGLNAYTGAGNSVAPVIWQLPDYKWIAIETGGAFRVDDSSPVQEPQTGQSAAASFTVSLSEPLTYAVSVAYSTVPNSASTGLDFTATTGTITFLSGETQHTVLVPVLHDQVAEGDETFGLQLASPAAPGAGLVPTIADGQATGTILGRTTHLAVARPPGPDASLEGSESSAPRTQTFTVTRVDETDSALDVDWRVAVEQPALGDTRGASAADISGDLQGTVHFAAGSTEALIAVQIMGDQTPEWSEYFKLDLTEHLGSGPIAGTLSTNGLILNDDWPTLTVTSASAVPFSVSGAVGVEEGGEAGKVRFELSAAAEFPINVEVTLEPGGWQADVTVTDVVIPAGRTSVTMPVASAVLDKIFEPIESGNLIFTATGGTDPNTGAPRQIDLTQANLPIQVIDQSLAEAGQVDLQKGIEWANRFIEYWNDTTKVAAALQGIDVENATGAAKAYLEALEKGAEFVKVAFDGTLVNLQLAARLEHAKSVVLLDPEAGAKEAYEAYKLANVDFSAGLLKTALAGSATAFAVGVMVGLGAAASAPVLIPVLLTIGVGWGAEYSYDELLGEAARHALEVYFESDNPEQDFIDGYIEENNTNPPVSDTINSDLTILLGPSQHNATLTGDGNVDATGNDLDNVLLGNSGNNTLYGQAGNDTVNGGGGNDTIIAGGGAGDDLYDGGEGRDVITFLSTSQGIVVDLALGRASGPEIGADTVSGIEDVLGGSGADLIRGDVGANSLSGNGGADTLDGGAGNDSLSGGEGADHFVFEWTESVGATVAQLFRDGDHPNAHANAKAWEQYDRIAEKQGYTTPADTYAGHTLWSKVTSEGAGFENLSGVDTLTDFNFAEGDRIDIGGVTDLAAFAAKVSAVTVAGGVDLQISGEIFLHVQTASTFNSNWFV